jgi:hypothetical protein
MVLGIWIVTFFQEEINKVEVCSAIVAYFALDGDPENDPSENDKTTRKTRVSQCPNSDLEMPDLRCSLMISLSIGNRQ